VHTVNIDVPAVQVHQIGGDLPRTLKAEIVIYFGTLNLNLTHELILMSFLIYTFLRRCSSIDRTRVCVFV